MEVYKTYKYSPRVIRIVLVLVLLNFIFLIKDFFEKGIGESNIIILISAIGFLLIVLVKKFIPNSVISKKIVLFSTLWLIASVVSVGVLYLFNYQKISKSETPQQNSVMPQREESTEIKLLSPNGGEKWVAGKTYTISWTSKNINDVIIVLNQGASRSLLIGPETGVNASLGKFDWKPESFTFYTQRNDLKISIRDVAYCGYIDESTGIECVKDELPHGDSSDNYFSITRIEGKVMATQVIYFSPAEIPTETNEGSCWTTSLSVQRKGAWRCAVGNAIFDPCFTISGSKNLVCNANPVMGENGFLLKLAESLPSDTSVDNSGRGWGWLIELEDGTTCKFITGATGLIDDKRINYDCSDGSFILGDLQIGTIWKAEQVDNLQTRLTEFVPIRRVWQ
ncbi:MAG: hypothetical protein UY16_C0073G0004 [Candidatus Gottesmanbacteria bacterium GW2011_GWA2_47_9]|uniref:Uncharacterized protein n=1 Tax=Candidatus Gottesmanbacteria bacterium GW2011_GWA2_47_9 TaxID=1618445 RepID=A0A0G1TUW4_9BACT|nr:MAG: hypothetical protein UU61_C0037G0004 [Parcubacteria group bacterium GW2011_GWB1_41_4]KKU85627.1 MAG: hypothetical protein UY16_C0073G0004 [Candidatus Gottesmanbacteria bacterium GW2011_GWA2_47_9]